MKGFTPPPPVIVPAKATYQLFFGAGNTPAGATSWLFPMSGNLGAPSATIFEYEVTKPGTLSDFYISNGRLSGAVNVAYDAFKNGVATGITGILNSGSAVGLALAGTVAVIAGDRVSVSVTNAGVLLANGPGMRTLMTEA